MDNSIDISGQQNIKNKKTLRVFIVFGILIVVGYYIFSAPFGSKDVMIHIRSGEKVNSVISELENKNVIRYHTVLKIFIKLFKNKNDIVTGDYLIYKNSPVWVVAWQISRGRHNIEPTKITFREGLTNEQMSELLSSRLAGFKKDLFLAGVEDKQGYLFPDTYFLFPLDEVDEIIEKLTNNFNTKIKSIDSSIKASGKSLSDIIIMASILEGEAGGKGDIEIISGILWQRIAIGMPLQVDVDKTTYKNKGLPEKPLNNPGLLSINAALNPEKSSYLYYLHQKNGTVHFAKTFEEHKKNITKYLK